MAILIFLIKFPTPDARAQETEVTNRSTAGLGRVEKTLDGEREARALVETFFAGIESGKITSAFGELTKGSPMAAEKETVDRLVKQTVGISESYGAFRSHELIRVNRLGGRMVRFTYFSYSDQYPLRWEIYCFRGKGGWQVIDLAVNSEFRDLFDAQRKRSSSPAPASGG